MKKSPYDNLKSAVKVKRGHLVLTTIINLDQTGDTEWYESVLCDKFSTWGFLRAGIESSVREYCNQMM